MLPRFLGWIGCVLLGLGLAAPLGSMTSAPTDFDRLVRVAEEIAVVEILSTKPETFVEEGRTLVRTVVEAKVVERLKGAGDARITLRFMGGRVEGLGLTIPGMPQFRAGTTEVLFIAENGRAICPLVGLHTGRYQVEQRGAERQVFRHDGVPLTSVKEIGSSSDRQREPQSDRGAGLSLQDFTTAVRERLAALAR